MPRYHRVEDIIQLALALQAPGPGLCLEDIQQRFEVGRRTAERMREAVDRLYPGMTSTKGRDGRKFWRLPAGEANSLVTWQPEELDALGGAIRQAEAAGDLPQARVLSALHDKVEALTRAASDERHAAPEVEGPMERLRRAIVLDRQLVLHRRRADGERVTSRVEPYGLLGGPRLLLVAVEEGRTRPRLHPVSEIEEAEVLETSFERDPNVELRRYAANAFLPFEEEPMELCWRFDDTAADEALEYEFHPRQEIEHRSDGSVEIRFRTESLVEMAWHLFAWGDRVQSMDRPILKHRFHTMMRRALETRPEADDAPLRSEEERV